MDGRAVGAVAAVQNVAADGGLAGVDVAHENDVQVLLARVRERRAGLRRVRRRRRRGRLGRLGGGRSRGLGGLGGGRGGRRLGRGGRRHGRGRGRGGGGRWRAVQRQRRHLRRRHCRSRGGRRSGGGRGLGCCAARPGAEWARACAVLALTTGGHAGPRGAVPNDGTNGRAFTFGLNSGALAFSADVGTARPGGGPPAPGVWLGASAMANDGGGVPALNAQRECTWPRPPSQSRWGAERCERPHKDACSAAVCNVLCLFHRPRPRLLRPLSSWPPNQEGGGSEAGPGQAQLSAAAERERAGSGASRSALLSSPHYAFKIISWTPLSTRPWPLCRPLQRAGPLPRPRRPHQVYRRTLGLFRIQHRPPFPCPLRRPLRRPCVARSAVPQRRPQRRAAASCRFAHQPKSKVGGKKMGIRPRGCATLSDAAAAPRPPARGGGANALGPTRPSKPSCEGGLPRIRWAHQRHGYRQSAI